MIEYSIWFINFNYSWKTAKKISCGELANTNNQYLLFSNRSPEIQLPF